MQGNLVGRPSTAPPLVPEDTAAGSAEGQEAARPSLRHDSEVCILQESHPEDRIAAYNAL